MLGVGWGGVGEVRGFLNCLHGKKRQPTLVKGIHPPTNQSHYGHHKQMVVNPKKITCISAFGIKSFRFRIHPKDGEGRVL